MQKKKNKIKEVIRLIISLFNLMGIFISSFIMLFFVFPLFMLLPLTISIVYPEEGWNIKFKLKQYISEWMGCMEAFYK